MEIIKVTGSSYPNAHELPCDKQRITSKHVSNKGGGNSAKRVHAAPVPPATPAIRKRDQEITAANQMMLLIVNGKRRFVRASEYKR